MPVVGTAGWSIPRRAADRFSVEGSGLSRYASVFDGVEINSTFYRRHKLQTFERWRDSVPETFRFSVKLPKHITHELKLQGPESAFEQFLSDIRILAPKLGPLLCQLPPSLEFGASEIEDGLRSMRRAFEGPMVIEPRHPTWISTDAIGLLEELKIDRVLADPSPIGDDIASLAKPSYVRLHGKPKIYYTSYTDAEIADFVALLAPDSWCIFDNTASGAAVENALSMLDLCAGTGGKPSHNGDGAPSRSLWVDRSGDDA